MMKIRSKLAVVFCALLMVACKQQDNKMSEQENHNVAKDFIMYDDSQTLQMTIYEGKGHRIYLEKGDYGVYCYADSQRVVFNDEYMDDGAMAMSFHCPVNSRYIYIVGDIVPNSNGWTVRFHLYRMDKRTFAVKHIGNFAAIHFEDGGFKAATARLLNSDAECTADERYAIQDNYYNYDGMLIRKGKNEYAYDDMEREYGDTLVNACGFHYGS